MKNTKERGVIRFLIYKRKEDKLFTGICLDLDIVEQAEDVEFLRKSLIEAAQGYVEAVCKNNLTDNLLNKPIPKKYEQILVDIENYLRVLHKNKFTKKETPVVDSQFFTREVSGLCVA